MNVHSILYTLFLEIEWTTTLVLCDLGIPKFNYTVEIFRAKSTTKAEIYIKFKVNIIRIIPLDKKGINHEL